MPTTLVYQEHLYDLHGTVQNVVDTTTEAVIGHTIKTRHGWKVRDAGPLVVVDDLTVHPTPDTAGEAIEAARAAATHLTPNATGLSDFDRRILDAAVASMNRPDTFDPQLLTDLHWSNARAWAHAHALLQIPAGRQYAPLLSARLKARAAAREELHARARRNAPEGYPHLAHMADNDAARALDAQLTARTTA